MSKKKKRLIHFIPLFAVIIALAVIIYFRWYQYLSFTALKNHHDQLALWTQQHYLWVASGYIAIYILVVAISLPGAVFLTLAGGFLFGIIWGTIFTVFAATIGAGLLFLAVKTAFGSWLATKAGPWLKKMEQGFAQNSVSYLLFLRFVPLFPFWAVNIVAALLNMRLLPFLLATFVGIIPGTLVYVAIGNGLGKFFAENQTPDLQIIFKPAILLPILGLAVLSLVPIIYRKFKGTAKTRRTPRKGK